MDEARRKEVELDATMAAGEALAGLLGDVSFVFANLNDDEYAVACDTIERIAALLMEGEMPTSTPPSPRA